MTLMTRTAATFLLGMIAACCVAQHPENAGELVDHGVGVPLAERRGVVVAQDANGRNLVIACSLDLSPRGWILVTDVDSGESEQIYCPEGVPNAAPYGSVMARTGKFYTSQGRTLLEFDPTSREWTFQGIPSNQVRAFLTIIEAPDGTIWTGDVYRAGLCSFDPQTREMLDHGRMDDREQYLSHLAVDDAGWVYCGIGTSRGNIVAYNLDTKEKLQIVDEQQRKVGTCTVHRGVDGKVYGKADLTGSTVCYRLFGGNAEVIEQKEMAQKEADGAIGWGGIFDTLPDGRRITAYDMEGKQISIQDPASGETREIALDYESEGSVLRVITGGPDGRVWANSAHPSRGVSYDPVTDSLQHYPGAIAVKGYGVQGKYIFGGHYGGGKLYVFDTTLPWNMAATQASLRGGLPGDELEKIAHSDEGKIDWLEQYNIVLFRAENYGGQIHFDLEAPEDGSYTLVVAPYMSPGYCTVQFLLNGQPLGEPFEANAPAVEQAPFQVFGPLQLKAGPHKLSVKTIEGKAGNPWIGISSILLTQETADQAIAEVQAPNPCMVAAYAPDINVPWGACAHPDGKHILISGTPGYGYIGGGIGIYDLETEESTLLTHEQLIPNHSIMAMAPLDNGDIACVTTVKGGHGTTAIENEGALFFLDWDTRTISFTTTLLSGINSIGLLRKGSDGMLYALADNGTLVVFDPQSRETVHTANLNQYGSRVANGMELGEDGDLYMVMTKGILRIKPGTYDVELLGTPTDNITAGIAVIKGRVYFGIGSRLWSCSL